MISHGSGSSTELRGVLRRPPVGFCVRIDEGAGDTLVEYLHFTSTSILTPAAKYLAHWLM